MSTPPDIDWNNLRAAQDEITRWATEQFPHRTDHHAIHKLMVEEIPEMAMHKKEKGTEEIGTELADCLILLLDLASLWEVDVVDALRAKMEINYLRKWDQDANGIMQHVPVIHPAVTEVDLSQVECPNCKAKSTEAAAVTSIYQYHCQLCDHYFDDDIPF